MKSDPLVTMKVDVRRRIRRSGMTDKHSLAQTNLPPARAKP